MLENNSRNQANNSSLFQTIKKNQHDRVVINILADSIIWERVSNAMFEIVNAFHPDKCENEFNTNYKYQGYTNAFILMGLNNEDLEESLGEIYCDCLNLKNPKSQIPADELAETIYIEWLLCIKNYCATLKTVA